MGKEPADGHLHQCAAESSLVDRAARRGHRDAEIACGFQLIPGDVAESAGVYRQRVAQHELHGEISDRRTVNGICRVEPAADCLIRVLPVELASFLKARVRGNISSRSRDTV